MKRTTKNTQYNERNCQTCVVTVGGRYVQKSNEIYYCLSNELRNEKNDENIWHLSKITLPFPIDEGECIITHKKSETPKLIVLGGYRAGLMEQNLHIEFLLSDIIGNADTWNEFFNTQ